MGPNSLDTIARAQGEMRVGWIRVTPSKTERAGFKGGTEDT